MFGKYRHSVDPKGRLFVPAKLREELGDAFYVTLGLDHCVSVYTEAAWQRCMEKYNNLSMSQAGRCACYWPTPPSASRISRAVS